jgi:hypothetical protein
MPKANPEALKLPDSLLVRYYREAEIESIQKVSSRKDGRIEVQLRIGDAQRTDHWRDLDGGIGYVPDTE